MTDKTISIYWFFVLFIIASAMVFVVYSLYGKPLDVRGIEGIFLEERLADCVNRGGEIPLAVLDNKGTFWIKNENLLEICHLNFDTEKVYEWNNDQFFVSLDFSAEGQDPPYSVSFGNENLKINSNLNLVKSKTNLNFLSSFDKKIPFCESRNIYSKGADGKYYFVKVFSCVRKTEKNV